MIIGEYEFSRLNSESIIMVNFEPYNYFEKYKRYSKTKIGQSLFKFRKGYVESLSNEGTILDFGAGYGDLVCKDTSGRWLGTDVMLKTEERLKKRFVPVDMDIKVIQNICLFDVLEHLINPTLEEAFSQRNRNKI